jgi:hypothetical protein
MRAPFWEGLILGLLVGAGLVLTTPQVVTRLARWRAPAVALHPAVAVQPLTLRLTNTDLFAWQHVQLALNARVPGEGYTFHLPHLATGALVELEFTRFTARDGLSHEGLPLILGGRHSSRARCMVWAHRLEGSLEAPSHMEAPMRWASFPTRVHKIMTRFEERSRRFTGEP